jgi:hypothetical protein
MACRSLPILRSAGLRTSQLPTLLEPGAPVGEGVSHAASELLGGCAQSIIMIMREAIEKRLLEKRLACWSAPDQPLLLLGLLGVRARAARVRVEIMGSQKCRIVGESQPVLTMMMINPILSTRSRRRALRPGTPVVMAGGDGQVFTCGLGDGRADTVADDGLMLTLGTSVVLSMAAQTPTVDPAFRTLAAATLSQLAPRGGGQRALHSYTLESVVQSGTLILRWFLDEFRDDHDAVVDKLAPATTAGSSGDGPGRGGRSFAVVEAAAAAVPHGAEGLVTIPHWCDHYDNYDSTCCAPATLLWPPLSVGAWAVHMSISAHS